MNPLSRRRSERNEKAIQAAAEKEAARKVALAVSIALKKAEMAATEQQAVEPE